LQSDRFAVGSLGAIEIAYRDDPSVVRLRSLSEELQQTPPADDWDGVTVFRVK